MLNMTRFKEDFIDSCNKELREAGAADFYIEERMVNKAQRGELNGLLFRRPDSLVAPTLYVEDFYEMYRRGRSVRSLSQDAVHSVISSLDLGDSIAEYSSRLDPAESCLNVRVLSKRKNRQLLRKIPYKDLGCGLVLIADWVYGEFRAMVTNEIVKGTGLTEEQLFDDALSSMAQREPAVLYHLTDAIMDARYDGYGSAQNLLDENAGATDPSAGTQNVQAAAMEPHVNAAADAPPEGSALILSNSPMFRGAAALFYPGVIDKIHALLNDDYYIIPSSIHEFIIVPARGADPVELARMLREANREVVSDEDVLADDIFMSEGGTIRRVTYGGVIPASSARPC